MPFLQACAEGCSESNKAQGFDTLPKACIGQWIPVITSIALFIIGCIGAAGTFPGSNIDWFTIVLAVAAPVLTGCVAKFDHPQRKIFLVSTILIALTLIPIGALGGIGFLSTAQVGWGIVGTYLTALCLGCIFNRIFRKQIQEYMQSVVPIIKTKDASTVPDGGQKTHAGVSQALPGNHPYYQMASQEIQNDAGEIGFEEESTDKQQIGFEEESTDEQQIGFGDENTDKQQIGFGEVNTDKQVDWNSHIISGEETDSESN